MKAQARTKTTVTINISMQELVEFVRTSGIHVPEEANVSIDIWEAEEFGGDVRGVTLDWNSTHDEQG